MQLSIVSKTQSIPTFRLLEFEYSNDLYQDEDLCLTDCSRLKAGMTQDPRTSTRYALITNQPTIQYINANHLTYLAST